MDFAWTITKVGKDCDAVFYAADTQSFTYRRSRDRQWRTIKRKKARHARDPRGARDEVIEMLVPVGDRGVGLTPHPELKFLIFAEAEGAKGRTDWIR